ncbi:MAG TPA: 4Fe-4S binding protein [Spirochaetia bacterium]|nr:4Fe-4S binding protein [Spirochaetia bacterium]
MRKWVNVKFNLCRPEECDLEWGICKAAIACSHNLLQQEEPRTAPMLMSMSMCVGCGDCVTACPYGALEVTGGY